ncbi:MAG: CHAD domain-containing protein [Hahellaceae bacterium]|nr:CHAD domain-containing protein [Hahellaceae bacterium]MCP5169355.1 CHAD domain-containing protein [Hahellaceae bacterium]
MALIYLRPDTLAYALLTQLADNLKSLLIIAQREHLSPAQVHAIRVQTKQSRALLRLFHSPGQHARSGTHAAMREIAQRFAGKREAHVLRKTLLQLMPGTDTEQHLLPLVIDALPPVDATQHQTGAQITLQPLTLNELDPEGLLQGLKRTQSKAKRRCQQAKKSDLDNDFHAWRKWIKYELYQLEWLLNTQAMNKSDRKKAKRRIHKLAELGNDLGKFQDLCVLEIPLARIMEDNSHHAVPFERWQLLNDKLRQQKRLLKKHCLKQAKGLKPSLNFLFMPPVSKPASP